MSAPERIYMDADIEVGDGYWTRCFETPKPCSEPALEYVRADITADRIATLEARAEAAEARLAELTGEAMVERLARALADQAYRSAFGSVDARARSLLTLAGILAAVPAGPQERAECDCQCPDVCAVSGCPHRG